MVCWSGSADLVVRVFLSNLLLRLVLGLQEEESVDDKRSERPKREEGEKKCRVSS